MRFAPLNRFPCERLDPGKARWPHNSLGRSACCALRSPRLMSRSPSAQPTQVRHADSISTLGGPRVGLIDRSIENLAARPASERSRWGHGNCRPPPDARAVHRRLRVPHPAESGCGLWTKDQNASCWRRRQEDRHQSRTVSENSSPHVNSESENHQSLFILLYTSEHS
jgi:hypothetical protein